MVCTHQLPTHKTNLKMAIQTRTGAPSETDKVQAPIEVRVCKEVRTFGTLQEG